MNKMPIALIGHDEFIWLTRRSAMYTGPASNKHLVGGISASSNETILPAAGIVEVDTTLSDGPYYAFQPYTEMTITEIEDADGFSGGSNLLNIPLEPFLVYNW